MNIGLMWFDRSDTDLKTKIENAMIYYQKKYGQKAMTCFVNPSMLEGGVTVEGIEVKANRNVLPSYLWLGTEKRSI